MTWDQLGQSGAVVVVAAVVWWLVGREGKRAVLRLASDDASGEYGQRVQTLWVVIRRVIHIVIVLIAFLTIALIWGVPATPFVAVGTTVGVALGFGAQSVVADVIAGFLIISEHQFDIGDVISAGGVSGTVEDVRLRVTVLRDLEGVVHYVPNGEIKVASNFTQEYSRLVLDLGVAYDSDLDTVLAVVTDELASMAQNDRWVLPLEVDVLGVNELASSAVIVRAVLTTHPDDRWGVKREALRLMKLRFDAEGIAIPFDQVAVHFRGQRPSDGLDT